MASPADKSTALWVLRRLKEAGFEALFAGGCVRDMLLGYGGTDYDVATNATPQQVRKLFPHVLLIGAKFGVAMVIHNRRKVEVTTFRSDLSYSDGRRPDGVRFATAEEDAQRRDFTINGMFYDPLAERVIDFVGGQEDLRRGVVRTIGRPDHRFEEDYLRMLRAPRFAVRLGFTIEPATVEAIRRHAAKITSISGERIFDELSKMLARKSAGAALRQIEELHLAQHILPEPFDAAQWTAAVERVGSVAAREDLRLALGALLSRLPQETIGRIIRRWGGANELRDSLCWLARHWDDWQTAADMPLCRFKRLLGHEDYQRLRRLWLLEERERTGGLTHCRRIARRARSIPPEKIAPKPLVHGGDLIDMGLKPGPGFGKILNALYDAQLNEELTTRKQARDAAWKMIAELRSS